MVVAEESEEGDAFSKAVDRTEIILSDSVDWTLQSALPAYKGRINSSSDRTSTTSVIGLESNTAAIRGSTLDPNLVWGVKMCENEWFDCNFANISEIVSTNALGIFA